ncbi:MAG TPA: oligoribonuclease [Candidatus Saccharibacteria bacterium]|nr:oligoribonuclease [Candidatus Saccharibacteria bacterium]
MNATKNDIPQKLLWLDLEMTGLIPATDRILEIAAIVTDFNFTELDRYESVVYQPPEVLARMNEWSRSTHTASGLLDRVNVAPNEQRVVADFLEFVLRNFGNEPVVLAGNSIHQDRRFIRQWWPDIEARLHYRMLDVSSFKIVIQGKYGKVFNKKETHRALDDIKESIAELQYYLSL